jgi:hypothetical protein
MPYSHTRSAASYAVLFFAACLGILQATCANASYVWYERPVAKIATGTDGKGHPVLRVATLGLLGPDSVLQAAQPAIQQCVQSSMDTAFAGVDDLDQLTKPFSTIEEQLKEENKEIRSANIALKIVALLSQYKLVLKHVQDQFVYRASLCLNAIGENPSSFSVAVAFRACEYPLAGRCSQLDGLGGDIRFEKLFEWFTNGGPIVINRWKIVSPAGEAVAATVVPTEMTAAGVQMWMAEPSPQTQLAQMENLLSASARAGKTIDYTIAPLMRLSLEQGEQTLEAYNAAGRALAHLRKSAEPIEVAHFVFGKSGAAQVQFESVPRSATKFVKWSDEVARTRLKECGQYRGIGDISAIGKCAGYHVDAEEFATCLSGKSCAPAPVPEALQSVATLIRFDPNQEKISIELPRIASFSTYGDLEANARACTMEKQSDVERTLCFVGKTANPQTKAALDCITTQRASGQSESKCLLDAVAAPNVKSQAKCVLNATNDITAAALCAAQSAYPPQVQQAINCYRDAGGNDEAIKIAACVAGSGNNADQQQALKCYNENRGQWSSAVLCYASKGGRLPEPVANSLECATSADWQAFAQCAAGKAGPKLPGDLGKLANCAAANGGATLGTATCLVGGQLSPEQRILLQCATHSVDATSFAICTGGSLALKEFAQCQHSKFGEDKCFGENNEIRKFFRNVLGQDINSNTVVGQVINAPLEIVKAIFNANPPPITLTTIGHTRVCLPWC